jgi:hypothetical protein
MGDAGETAPHKYYIGDAIKKPAIHHNSYKDLWESKWQGPVRPSTPPHPSPTTRH